MKSYTDIEQSKKLAEILPLESADMYYDRGGLPSLIDKYVTHESIKNDKYHHLIPCWSLAALLGVLPKLHKLQHSENGYYCSLANYKYVTDAYDNPIDACYELILKLHELNLL